MRQTYRYWLVALVVIASVAGFQGCGRTRTEARFLRDYRAVLEISRAMAEQAPKGFEPEFGKLMPRNLAPTEENIRDYMQGDSFRQVTFRRVAAQAEGTNASADAAVLLKHYFGDLERNGFTSGVVGFPKMHNGGPMEVASKSWANKDRTLIVEGQVITDRASGEIVASINYWGTLNRRAR